jgi:hypothetical protein
VVDNGSDRLLFFLPRSAHMNKMLIWDAYAQQKRKELAYPHTPARLFKYQEPSMSRAMAFLVNVPTYVERLDASTQELRAGDVESRHVFTRRVLSILQLPNDMGQSNTGFVSAHTNFARAVIESDRINDFLCGLSAKDVAVVMEAARRYTRPSEFLRLCRQLQPQYALTYLLYAADKTNEVCCAPLGRRC